MRIRSSALIILLAVISLLSSCDFFSSAIPGIDENTYLGLPSEAAAGESQLIVHDAYTVLYSYDLLMPLWVSWHLDAADFEGTIPRPDDFSPDEALPDEYQTVHEDYTKSGFSRGHLCPNADRDGNRELQLETFLTSNIVPQNQSLNGGDWASLEDYCRTLAEKRYELYIVTGAIQGTEGGMTSGDDPSMKKSIETDDGREITVPSYLWKAAVAISEDDGDDLARIEEGDDIYAVAVLFSNEPFSGSWKDAVVPIDRIEKLAGIDLFSSLPGIVESSLESVSGALPAV